MAKSRAQNAKAMPRNLPCAGALAAFARYRAVAVKANPAGILDIYRCRQIHAAFAKRAGKGDRLA